MERGRGGQNSGRPHCKLRGSAPSRGEAFASGFRPRCSSPGRPADCASCASPKQAAACAAASHPPSRDVHTYVLHPLPLPPIHRAAASGRPHGLRAPSTLGRALGRSWVTC
eukprot:360146-Chlamydomonas_euryale.AAC.1